MRNKYNAISTNIVALSLSSIAGISAVAITTHINDRVSLEGVAPNPLCPIHGECELQHHVVSYGRLEGCALAIQRMHLILLHGKPSKVDVSCGCSIARCHVNI